MRVAIASRIFAPEPSAASFRLSALADSFACAGDAVEVLTVKTARNSPKREDSQRRYKVKRFPVLRDKHGYVRGYIQYLSFDLPLFFRVLFGQKRDLIVVEPPPTTGFFVRIAAAIRRTPYAYYAADIWSDAVAGTDAAPGLIARVLRGVEKFALRGAAVVFSVSEGVTNRLQEIGLDSQNIVTIGNGVDLDAFPIEGEVQQTDGPYFVYAGTASEVHGARIFVDAFQEFHKDYPETRLVFIGQGTEREAISEVAATMPEGAVVELPRQEPSVVAEWLRGAIVSLASSRPGQGYDFGFPTKMYASVAVGTPVIFAGLGPAIDFLRTGDAGWAVEYDEGEVVAAMTAAYAASSTPEWREQRRPFAMRMRESVGLNRVADLAVAASHERVSSAKRRWGR